MTRVEFILKVMAERFNHQGWVLFSDLEPVGILPEFIKYCAQNGCTLTTFPGKQKQDAAPYADFETFIRGVRAPD